MSRFVSILLIVCLLGSCTQQSRRWLLTKQVDDEFRMRTGFLADEEIDEGPVGPVAARLLPYALLAEQAKFDHYYFKGADLDQRIISDYCGRKRPCDEMIVASSILSEWKLIGAWEGWENLSERFNLRCANNLCDPLDGLAVQVWIKRQPLCEEAVLSFRGTKGNVENWLSNFHWLSRHLGIIDQYDQVRYIANDLVDLVNSECGERKPRIAAVGHSLGGGLAQHAAYQNAVIRRIYGFNPTIVTGSLDFGRQKLKKGKDGLVVERVYESGEILQFPRRVMGKINPISRCNPRTVNIRFNFEHGGASDQHRITNMARQLIEASDFEAPKKVPMADEPCNTASRASSARP